MNSELVDDQGVNNDNVPGTNRKFTGGMTLNDLIEERGTSTMCEMGSEGIPHLEWDLRKMQCREVHDDISRRDCYDPPGGTLHLKTFDSQGNTMTVEEYVEKNLEKRLDYFFENRKYPPSKLL